MKTMKRVEAKKLARKLYKDESRSTAEIAVELEKAGYISQRTGEPLTVGGVNAMLYSKRKPKKAKTSKVEKLLTKEDKARFYDVISAIMQTNLPDSDKVALNQLLTA